MEDAWYQFAAYNSQAYYGYGCDDEAEFFEDYLNRGRDANLYHRTRLTDKEAAELRLDDRDDTVNLGDDAYLGREA
jgi:hypothetical protein